jgi:predicted phage terminase large subunit-like protein
MTVTYSQQSPTTLVASLARQLVNGLDPDSEPEEVVEARVNLIAFTRLMFGRYEVAEHIELLCAALERAAVTPGTRLIVTMPPRHSKSLHISEHFPAWYLGNFPENRIIAASHGGGLAYKFSRMVRNKFLHWRWPFPNVKLARDKGAVGAWDINGTRGGYVAVGVGGSPTGEGANLILIDDPIRNAADADSDVIRENLWTWYTGTLRTRLEPGGSIVLTACMTGDTGVLRPDGTETPLRDIRPGDIVATYEEGELTTALVSMWAEYRPDSIYEIRTKSGILARANDRHPFLVERDGKQEWIRLKNLKPGDFLIRARSLKERGAESNALTTDAISPLSVRDTATATTTKLDGRRESGARPSTMNPVETHNSNDDTESPLLTTIGCSQSRAGDALSVTSSPLRLPVGTQQIERTDGSSWIIVTIPEESVDYFVTNVISPSDTVIRRSYYSAPLPTSDFTPDEILSITWAGDEPVYDITVERTANFIANGVVSHNTRWHEDDLTGRLLAEAEAGTGEQWEHIHLPAIATEDVDDPIGRAPGEALWPSRWPLEALETMRRVDARVFAAQYQGKPSPETGSILKDTGPDYYAVTPSAVVSLAKEVVVVIDSASKTAKQNDFTAIAVWADVEYDNPLGLDAGYYIVDHLEEKVEFDDLVDLAESQYLKYKIQRPGRKTSILVEEKSSGIALIQTLQRKKKIPVIAYNPGSSDKIERAKAIRGYWNAGIVKLCGLPGYNHDAFLKQHKEFPYAKHDDSVDTSTSALWYFEVNPPEVKGTRGPVAAGIARDGRSRAPGRTEERDTPRRRIA